MHSGLEGERGGGSVVRGMFEGGTSEGVQRRSSSEGGTDHRAGHGRVPGSARSVLYDDHISPVTC